MIVAELVVSTSLVGIALLVWNFVINKWQSCENSCVQENKGRSSMPCFLGNLIVQTMKAFGKVNINVMGVRCCLDVLCTTHSSNTNMSSL